MLAWRAVPKMMFDCAVILLCTMLEISWTLYILIPGPPVILTNARWAPVMSTSSNGLSNASLTASNAPPGSTSDAWPTPIHAGPAFVITARTSAKSKLTSPGSIITRAIPSTPSLRTLSAMRQAS